MTLLNIFHTGGLTLVLTIIALGLLGWFWYQAWQQTKEGTIKQTKEGTIYDSKRLPFYKVNMFWYGVAIIVLYIVALLIINSDYKGV
jgi:hypothetical protein